VPGREELGAFNDEIPTIEGRLYFMLYATSGLRRKEGFSLRLENVDEEMRMITPNKGWGARASNQSGLYQTELDRFKREYFFHFCTNNRYRKSTKHRY